MNVVTYQAVRYNLAEFIRFGITYRIERGVLAVQKNGKFYKLDSAVARNVIAAATGNNPVALVYTPRPILADITGYNRGQLRRPRARVLEVLNPEPMLNRFDVEGRHHIFGLTDVALYDILRKYFEVNPAAVIKINVSRRNAFESINNVQSIFTSTSPVSAYKPIIRLLTAFLWKRYEYEDPVAPQIQLVQLPMINPVLEGYRDGVYNCACTPVIEYLETLKPSVNNRRAIKRVKAISDLYLESGIGEVGLAELAKTSSVRLLVIDATGAVWREYTAATKTHTSIILYAHNAHFTRVLAADQYAINFVKIGKQEITWLPPNYNFDELNSQNIDGNSITSKEGQVALVTDDMIYKTRFAECEDYPNQFTNGSVGKAKFVEQCPAMKYGLDVNDPFYQIYFDVDVSGFYCENGYSNVNNVKYDHNHSYKSFTSSPAGFRGFPIISAVFGVNAPVSISTHLFKYDGLFYLEVPQMTANDLKSPIYYEGSNWYPIEIVKYWFEKYGINPTIKAFAYAATSFNCDFGVMSNSQFRCFVGKTTARESTSTWRTTNNFEYLRGIYQLQESIVGVQQYKAPVTESHPEERTIYEITYKNDKPPWQLPVISAYVKAHQKVLLFEKYNALLAIDVVPVVVRIDGIEIAKVDAEKVAASNIFDLGTTPGQWKLEPIKPQHVSECAVLNRYHERDVPAPHPLLAKGRLVKFTADAILPQLVHFSGPGGNGKTHRLIELKRTYPSLCISAPTHEACDVITKRAAAEGIECRVDTYHRIFGIGCPANIPNNTTMFAVDECSMIPEEHLIHIDTTLKNHFKNKLPFGGAQIILLGDFWQLPPISPMVSLHNNWSGVKAELYKLFTEIELTKNWRQGADPAFYSLCQKIRTKLTQEEAIGIITYLNQRVSPRTILPSYASLDDMYIAGVNEQTAEVNEPYKGLPVGSKVICQVGCSDLEGIKIPKGKVLVVTKNEPGNFHISDQCDDANTTYRFKSAGLLKAGKGKSRFAPAMALTVHKSQGKTLKGNVVIDPTRLFERNHLYTALTRATCFANIHLTAPISFHQFSRTAFVIGISKEPTNLNSKRLESMVTTYKHEEPRLTYKFLSDMRANQNNFCCYCRAPMVDTFGYDDSITLERIDDAQHHILENVKLACFKCNSRHVKITVV